MVSPGDFGLYSCHANNKLGGASAETLIAVEVEYVPFLFFCLGLFIEQVHVMILTASRALVDKRSRGRASEHVHIAVGDDQLGTHQCLGSPGRVILSNHLKSSDIFTTSA